MRYDLDLDGDVDAADSSRASITFQGTMLGWGVLTNSAVANRKGYAGYEYDEAVSKYHVLNRILDPALGRWTRRDPLGYVDGMSLYEYVGSMVVDSKDPTGRGIICCCTGKWTKTTTTRWMCTRLASDGKTCYISCVKQVKQTCPGKYFCLVGSCTATQWVPAGTTKTITGTEDKFGCCEFGPPGGGIGKMNKICSSTGRTIVY